MNITTVRTKAESIAQNVLGSSFSPLQYAFDLELNDSRDLMAGFAVTWGAASQTYFIDQILNIEQDLELVITKRAFVRSDDSKVISTGDSVYTAIGSILKRFILDRFDNLSNVQQVVLTNMGKPEFIGQGRDILYIPLTFRVRYTIT